MKLLAQIVVLCVVVGVRGHARIDKPTPRLVCNANQSHFSDTNQDQRPERLILQSADQL